MAKRVLSKNLENLKTTLSYISSDGVSSKQLVLYALSWFIKSASYPSYFQLALTLIGTILTGSNKVKRMSVVTRLYIMMA